MSDELLELRTQIHRLESRLAAAKSDLGLKRDRWQRSRSTALLALAVIAAFTLISAAPEKAPLKAPFVVVNSENKRIFEVRAGDKDNPRGFALFSNLEVVSAKPPYSSMPQEALGLGIKPQASFFKAQSPAGTYQAVMGLADSGKTPALGLRSGSGNTSQIAMAVKDGKPSLEMQNEKNVGIVQVTQGDAGGGALLLSDGKGQARVLFGVTPKNAGKVIAYPNTLAGGAMSGLYSSMICGLAGCQ